MCLLDKREADAKPVEYLLKCRACGGEQPENDTYEVEDGLFLCRRCAVEYQRIAMVSA